LGTKKELATGHEASAQSARNGVEAFAGRRAVPAVPDPDVPPELVLDHLIENSQQSSAAIARELALPESTLSNDRIGRRKLTVDRSFGSPNTSRLIPRCSSADRSGAARYRH
jgi:hypothetical protein